MAYIGMLVALSELPLSHSLGQCRDLVKKQAQTSTALLFEAVTDFRGDDTDLSDIVLEEFVSVRLF